MVVHRALEAPFVAATAVTPDLTDPYALVVAAGGLAMAVTLLVAARGLRRVEPAPRRRSDPVGYRRSTSKERANSGQRTV